MKSISLKKKLALLVVVAGLIIYGFSLPKPIFDDPYSTVLEDRTGQLLSASIAADGQWRFPERPELNEKFSKALVVFEDKRFWSHPGVDIMAIGRAIRENIRAGHVVSGGSTVTMQVIRMARHNPPRNVFQKLLEVILATRLELGYSKSAILNLYASHAPFGGNVVGIEAACWRYFGRNSEELSWGEAAMLAVLPNNPSLIHLARNRGKLRQKRDALLKKLLEEKIIDTVGYELALSEQIPESPQPLPRLASHLLESERARSNQGQMIRSTIDRSLQVRTEQAVEDHLQKIRANHIFNVAAVIVDVQSGEVRAYVGNSKSGAEHHEDVDVIRSPRSTGSILKPFLFAAMQDEGKLLPGTLVPDVPTLINGFAPRNFSRQYDGAVPADKALIRSLNVPVVYELREFRYEKFYNLLKNVGMTTLTKPPDHFGLSLVLGGAEGTLWDITGMYASCARTLNNYFFLPGKSRYSKGDFHAPRTVAIKEIESIEREANSHLSASSIWITFETLRELYRPGEETGWKHFSSSHTIAWKTGTSFGFRDGWAIGVNPEYAVGVWVGNADGEGRPGLTGTEAAAPLLFEIFSMLPDAGWFQKPQSELIALPVCAQSGMRPSAYCNVVDTVAASTAGLTSGVCEYHKLVHLSRDKKYRLHSDCAPVDQMTSMGWFVLPPIQEYYFKKKSAYQSLPPYKTGCSDPASVVSMDIVYPKLHAKIYVPVQLDGVNGSTVFEATHRSSTAVVYWHLDGEFIGSTKRAHQFTLNPPQGKHLLTLVDDSGETLQRQFEIISSR
jgi:penicillin-binding protein 1C